MKAPPDGGASTARDLWLQGLVRWTDVAELVAIDGLAVAVEASIVGSDDDADAGRHRQI